VRRECAANAATYDDGIEVAVGRGDGCHCTALEENAGARGVADGRDTAAKFASYAPPRKRAPRAKREALERRARGRCIPAPSLQDSIR
jgi:hypothetical protein